MNIPNGLGNLDILVIDVVPRLHRPRRRGPALLDHRQEVLLLASEEPIDNLTFLL